MPTNSLQSKDIAHQIHPATNMRRHERIGPIVIDRLTGTLGYAGVPASFLLHAIRAGERFDVDPREIVVELGRRKAVVGQEDMIIDVAAALAKR